MSESSVTRQGVMRSGAWALSARIVTAVLGVILYALLARVLSQDDVGSYFAVNTLVMFVAGLGTLGIGKSIVRFIGEIDSGAPGSRRAVLVRGGAIAGTSGLIIGGGLLLADQFGVWEGRDWEPFAVVAAVLVALGTLRLLIPDGFRSLADIKTASLLGQAYPKIAITGFLAIAFFTGFTLTATGLLWFLAAVWVSIIVVGVVAFARRLPRTETESAPSVMAYLAIGVPWLSTLLGAFATLQFGVVAVAAVEGASEAAIYGAAWNLAVWVSVPHGIVIATIQPYIVRLWNGGEHRRLERLMRQSATGAGLLALVGFLGLVVFGRFILEVLFGPAYVDGYGILVVLAFGHLFAVATGATLVLLGLTGHQNTVLAMNLVLAPLVIIATLGMTSVGGSLGAAISGTLGIIILNIAGSVIVLRTVGVKTWAEASTDFLAGTRDMLSGRGLGD